MRAGLDLSRTDPGVGKALRDELAGLRSLRVGRFRIIYRVAARRLIDLVAIGPRRTIYQEDALTTPATVTVGAAVMVMEGGQRR